MLHMRWRFNPPQADLFQSIFSARKLISKSDQDLFLTPPQPELLTAGSVGISKKDLGAVTKILKCAAASQRPIIIYGDYDADGVTATGILYEALHQLEAKAYPFIPSRELHGYGLSLKGIQEALTLYCPPPITHRPLIITVDNGITAHETASYLKAQKLDLIITDHHQIGSTIPPCLHLVHTTQLSGAGIAWMLAKELLSTPGVKPACRRGREVHTPGVNELLDLAVIGTVADLMPVIGVNRSLVKYGLDALRQTQRPGLIALFKEAGIEIHALSTYHVGFIIAPRLNAMGRLKNALDSLRLLLTTNQLRAESLATELSSTNRDRQDLTQALIAKAHTLIPNPTQSILIIEHEDFHEGVIGLVAGKITEKYYRPSIVISKKDNISKASARSVSGVNIIELIRTQSHLLINAGGHPMAAGLSLSTDKIQLFKSSLETAANELIKPEQLEPYINIDSLIEFSQITDDLYRKLETLAPFGVGNPKPVFAAHQLKATDIRNIGSEGQHLKLIVKDDKGLAFTAVGFGMGDRVGELVSAKTFSLAFTIEENIWQSRRSLQLHLKDLSL
jgi:single-stranded-DNA-specific exonuclease